MVKNKYIEVLGGLTSRLSVLASIYAYGLNNQYNIIWDKQPGLNCYFEDLFINESKFIYKETIDTSRLNVQTYGSPYRIFDFHKTLLTSYKSIKDGGYSIIDTSDYIIMDYPYNHKEEFNNGHQNFIKLMKNLEPTPDINRVVDKYNNKIRDNTYGVYYRGCENTINQHNTQDYNIYYNIINKILESNNRVLLITGSKYLYSQMKRYNHPDILMIEEDDLPIDAGYTTNGVKRSLIDFLVLSKVKRAYIHNSSFGIKACIFGNVQYRTI